MKYALFIFLFCFLVHADDKAKKVLLTEAEIVDSALKNYPKVSQALQDVTAAKMKVMESYGAFDSKIVAKKDIRTRGYYDGENLDVTIEKPLPFLNSKIYTGYRMSDGVYPDYEGKKNTLDEGEIRGGLEFSLWQNRDIDERRLLLFNNRLNLSAKELNVFATKIKVKKEATKAFWNWVAKGNILLVYKELLAFAHKRDYALRKRISKGDLARIYQTENQTYIVKRSTQVIKAQRDFFEAALYLSLFYRDEEGNTVLPNKDRLPVSPKGETKITKSQVEKDIKTALNLNPDLKSIDLKISQLKNDELYGLNKLDPKIDINFEFSRDQGEGSKSLVGTENRAMIKIEIPIERNLGKGKVNKARAKKNAMRMKKKLTADTIQASIKSIFYRLNAAVDTITNSRQEIDLTQILRSAELEKFNKGASDFFVINLREQNIADAKVKNMKAIYDYHKAQAEYYAATASLMKGN